MGHVGFGTIDGDTSLRRIGDRVDLRVYRGLFMVVPHYGFVFAATQKSIVAHTDEAVVLHKDTPHFQSLTWRPDGRELGSLHEVFFPTYTGPFLLGHRHETEGEGAVTLHLFHKRFFFKYLS
jgi:hypothetical protein